VLGKTLGTGSDELTVVGVAADVKYYSLGEPERPYVYLPFTRFHRPSLTLLLRVDGDPSAMGTSVRRVVRGLGPNVALIDSMSLEELRRGPLAATRAMAAFSSFFGSAAILVTAVGLYGMVSYSVSGRTREIGLRFALGARRADVVRLLLRQAVLPTLLGTAIGVLAAGAIGPFLDPQLFGVGPNDPLTYASAVLGLWSVAGAACWKPAHRASGLDPSSALRVT